MLSVGNMKVSSSSATCFVVPCSYSDRNLVVVVVVAVVVVLDTSASRALLVSSASRLLGIPSANHILPLACVYMCIILHWFN
jgi:hypothetical protein